MGVPGVPLLPKDATDGILGERLDSQTANLDKANGRTKDLVNIIESCDKRNEEIVKELAK